MISTLAQTTVQVKTSLLVFKYLGSLQELLLLLPLKQILQKQIVNNTHRHFNSITNVVVRLIYEKRTQETIVMITETSSF